MAETPHHGRTQPRFSSTVTAPRLKITVEREAGSVTERTILVDGDSFRIGSNEHNEIRIVDLEVSRFHCQLVREKGAWRIRDMGSLNGTRVNGVPVRDADLIMPSSVIDIGASSLRIEEDVARSEVELVDTASFGAIFGRSLVMQKLFATLEKVAQTESNVLIEGESGTGKELVAAELVKRGPRANKPFVVIDCGALPPNLLESQLFGHVRGAFTGAEKERIGAFEEAEGGTVFLDEIGEMPLEMQPKLLRVLEARTVQRLGDNRQRPVDIRLVAATNRQLEREINAGRFREDLYFRLAVLLVHVPPLRARIDDVELLLDLFFKQGNWSHGRSVFTSEVVKLLQQHEWPGNVRELRNYVERAMVLREALPVGRALPSQASGGEPGIDVDLDVPFHAAKEALIGRFERAYVVSLLEAEGGNITQAAKRAGVDRMSLHRLISRSGLKPTRSFRE